MIKVCCPRLGNKYINSSICVSCYYYDNRRDSCGYRDKHNPKYFGEKK